MRRLCPRATMSHKMCKVQDKLCSGSKRRASVTAWTLANECNTGRHAASGTLLNANHKILCTHRRRGHWKPARRLRSTLWTSRRRQTATATRSGMPTPMRRLSGCMRRASRRDWPRARRMDSTAVRWGHCALFGMPHIWSLQSAAALLSAESWQDMLARPVPLREVCCEDLVNSRSGESSFAYGNRVVLTLTASSLMTIPHVDVRQRQELDVRRSTTVPAWWAVWVLIKYRSCRNFRSGAYLGARLGVFL